MNDLENYVTPEQLLTECRWLKKGTLRWWLFQRKTNGLDRAVVRLGRKQLLIDKVKFVEWIRSHRESE